jgi:hypothetical protein
LSLVPTQSALETSTGSFNPKSHANMPPKLPMSERTLAYTLREPALGLA